MLNSKFKTSNIPERGQHSTFIHLHPGEALAPFCATPTLPALDPEAVSRQNADAHWLMLDALGRMAARCSLWWKNTPPYPDQRVGLIGHYAARDAEAAAQLLHHACARLAEQGCTLAVGPMDGNTWQPYRLVTEPGSEPTFFLEPNNPDSWPAHFTNSGFSVLANYVSTLTSELNGADARLSKVAARAAARGITIRTLNPDCLEAELCHIYNISLKSFSRNFLYTPISEQEFMSMYRPLLPYVKPELILIAERADQPIGFLFAVPDLLRAQRGKPIDTVIIKTVAVHPDYQIFGLGSLLVARCQQIAHKLGFKRAIHALMHESNESCKISYRNNSQLIRRYGLFAKDLGGLSNNCSRAKLVNL